MKRKSSISKKGVTKKQEISEQKKKLDMSNGEPVHNEECATSDNAIPYYVKYWVPESDDGDDDIYVFQMRTEYQER